MSPRAGWSFSRGEGPWLHSLPAFPIERGVGRGVSGIILPRPLEGGLPDGEAEGADASFTAIT